MTKSKSLVLKKQLLQLVRVLKCSVKLLDEGRAGENVGVLIRGTKREDVERGQVLAKPGSINPHTKFEAEVIRLKQR